MHLGLKTGLAARRGGGGGGGGGGPSNSIPVITGVPTISGTTTEGETLTATPASVAGTPTPTRTWQWERTGTPISGATSITYTLQAVDVGETITVVQTETNSEGSDSAESTATASIGAAASSATMPAYVDSYIPSQASNVYTQSSLALGAGEFVVGIAYQSGGSGQTVTSMVVDGQTLTADAAANSANVSGVALYRVTTTSSSWDIVLTMSGALADGVAFFVWGAGSGTALVDTASSGAFTDLDPAIAVNVDSETGGKIIAIASVLGTNPSFDDLTGVAHVTDSPVTISLNDRVAALEASVTTGEAPRSVSVGWTGGGVHHAIAVLSIGAA
jgi:hypothetical protein